MKLDSALLHLAQMARRGSNGVAENGVTNASIVEIGTLIAGMTGAKDVKDLITAAREEVAAQTALDLAQLRFEQFLQERGQP